MDANDDIAPFVLRARTEENPAIAAKLQEELLKIQLPRYYAALEKRIAANVTHKFLVG